MATIEIKHLTFGYDEQAENLFDDATLTLDSHWKLGLVGRNGRGKTTLLRLLQGKMAYQGSITHPLEYVYFPAKISDPTQLTFYALSELENFEQWELERELNLIQLDPAVLWQPFDTLSGGEQTKILLALLFTQTARFALIDEPTNHLDLQARHHVATYLQQKNGFIVVSHDRTFLDQICDHILAIEKSQLVLYQGNFSTYETQKARQDTFELAQNTKLQKEVGRLKQTAAEKSRWSQTRESDKYGDPTKKKSRGNIDTGFIGARAARTMKRSKTLANRMEQQITQKEKLLKNLEEIDALQMLYTPTHHQQLLKAEQLQLEFDAPLFAPLNFELAQHEIVALTGPNGSGKSSVIHYLLGIFSGTSTGAMVRPQKLNISYVRQNYEANRGTLVEFATVQQLDYSLFLNNLRKLGMGRTVFATPIEKMSLGQRKKVELAKSLAQPAELFIWDEPLNYLDVFNQEQLAELLLAIKPAMLLVEHDETFLTQVATKKVALQSLD
ncbi:ribosomal protection-like ABC-F family protein [Enterococcus sp. CSURQ0835]|uniref:ribosomal protection-like ABC-F family protein n=1 Tax=Enterococcus sp. CSURQ0835 TaxID=2681394 RepID=UPI00135B4859|nr:ABC-F type ribosomal protection protein [Enterococcus sp. CSURQ0835]